MPRLAARSRRVASIRRMLARASRVGATRTRSNGSHRGDTDAELVDAMLAANNSAWTEFVRRFNEPLTAYANRIVGRRGNAAAKEVVANVYAKLLANDMAALRSFDAKRASLTTFLHTIARNASLDVDRSHKRRGHHAGYEETDVDDDGRARGVQGAMPSHHDTYRYVATRQSLGSLRDVLTPEEVRFMVDAESMSTKELADDYGIAEGTVGSRKFKLKRRLEEAGVDARINGRSRTRANCACRGNGRSRTCGCTACKLGKACPSSPRRRAPARRR